MKPFCYQKLWNSFSAWQPLATAIWFVQYLFIVWLNQSIISSIKNDWLQDSNQLFSLQVPETVGGRIVATLTSISGVIVLAFPITLIVNNFNRQYRATEVRFYRFCYIYWKVYGFDKHLRQPKITQKLLKHIFSRPPNECLWHSHRHTWSTPITLLITIIAHRVTITLQNPIT